MWHSTTRDESIDARHAPLLSRSVLSVEPDASHSAPSGVLCDEFHRVAAPAGGDDEDGGGSPKAAARKKVARQKGKRNRVAFGNSAAAEDDDEWAAQVQAEIEAKKRKAA